MVCDSFLNLLTAFSFLSLLRLQLDKKGIAMSGLSAKPIRDRQSQSLITTSKGRRFLHRTPKKLTGEKGMEMSFFALPSQQGPAQGRFKPTHLPISLSTKVTACVRRFETPTALNHGRAESKKDISMLFSPVSFSGVHFRFCSCVQTCTV